MCGLVMEPYLEQQAHWPHTGRHILAQADEETLVVYQAYSPAIGRHAVTHGVLGGEFSYSRMSWIKPNFLWMMYRSGWRTRANQEVTLGLRIRCAFFETLLAEAVPSTWDPERYPTRELWSQAVAGSAVRVQWDPDHDPHGAPQARRAIQLGLRGNRLRGFGTQELIEVWKQSAGSSGWISSSTRTRIQYSVDGIHVPACPATRHQGILPADDRAVPLLDSVS